MSKKNRKKKKKTNKARVAHPGGKPTRQHTLPLTPEEIWQKALTFHRNGELDQARALYLEITTILPRHFGAWYHLGILAKQQKENEQAIQCLQRAAALNGSLADTYFHLGQLYRATGKLEPAENAFKDACRRNPGDVESWIHMASILKDQGKFTEAENAYRKALSYRPDDFLIHRRLGRLLAELNRFEDAAFALNRSLKLKPDDAKTLFDLGNLCYRRGELEKAVDRYRDALSRRPDDVHTHNNLGNVLKKLGRLAEAVLHLQFAAHKINSGTVKKGYAKCLAGLSFSKTFPGLEQDVIAALKTPWVRPSALAVCALSVLKTNEQVSALLKLASGPYTQPDQVIHHNGFEDVVAMPLLLALLESTVVYGREMELFLVLARRGLLAAKWVDHEICRSDVVVRFARALAKNCFINEYAFYETQEETSQIENLRDRMVVNLTAGHPVDAMSLCLIAAYRPLYSLQGNQLLTELNWNADMHSVIRQQILDPLTEKQLSSDILRLTPIVDHISHKVRQHYEESPYPRWVKTALAEYPETLAGWRKAKFPFIHSEEIDEPSDILIAGCGTGQHSIETARRFSNSSCLAIDLSLPSLLYARRKTQELGITNLTYAQADILEMGRTGKRFHLIESVGVLHHLNNPIQGWQVLVDLLKPNGLMRIGLYSRYAREPLEPIRLFIKQQGYDTSPEAIRLFRHDIMATAPENALFERVLKWKDFYSLSEVRDLVFHVKEHVFTIPEIKNVLDSLGLRFLGFDASPTARRLYREHFPEDVHRVSLSRWHALEMENQNLFEAMYQFWAYKKK